MASKYGMQKYGANLYSSAWMLLEGVVDTSWVLAGVFTRSQPFEGTVPFSVSFGSAHFTHSQPLEGALPFLCVHAGIIAETRGYRGNISVDPVLVGDLFRSASRMFEGVLTLSVIPEGAFTSLWSINGVLIEIITAFGGGEDVYLGPFWDPDEPVDGGWTPDDTGDSPWNPIAPPASPWS